MDDQGAWHTDLHRDPRGLQAGDRTHKALANFLGEVHGDAVN